MNEKLNFNARLIRREQTCAIPQRWRKVMFATSLRRARAGRTTGCSRMRGGGYLGDWNSSQNRPPFSGARRKATRVSNDSMP
jgi:hypothetical protein